MWNKSPERRQARSTWLQIVKLLVEEGQCDPATAYCGITNFILHQWESPIETLKRLSRQDRLWLEIPVNGGLGHIYHSLATALWHEGPSVLLNVLWTEERAPYILHSRNKSSETVLFAVVWRQAWNIFCLHKDPALVQESSVDQLVSRLIRDGADVHTLDSSGFTPLNQALWIFVTHCDISPMTALNSAHDFREVFRIERVPSEFRIGGSQSGSGADLDRSTDSIWRFSQFLYWWFDRLDDSGYDLNDYIRQEETFHPPVYGMGRDDAIFDAKISRTFHYDKTAQLLELNVKWAWTKIEDIKDPSKRLKSIPHVCPRHMM